MRSRDQKIEVSGFRCQGKEMLDTESPPLEDSIFSFSEFLLRLDWTLADKAALV